MINRDLNNGIGRAKLVPTQSSKRASIRFVGLLAIACGTIALAAPARHTATESPQSIVAAVQPFVDDHTLAGAVMLVASADRILSLETVGYSDLAAHKPMRADAMFWIASQSKPMTVTALMMLVDEGKVNIDDPVEKYLPEFKGQWVRAEHDAEHILLKKPAHPITIRNILSHTSGLAATSPLEVPTLDLLPLAARVRSYAMMPLMFEPDTRYMYSNAGINTAGRIIEVVSGMPYEKFMDERLFRPLGMKDTTFWPSARQVQRLAKSYKVNAAKTGQEETVITQLQYPLTDRVRQPMPAGGLFSTASDVARFCQMILNGGTLDGKRYVSEAAVNQMTSRQTGPGLSTAYGFGWMINKDDFGHSGAYKTNMEIDRQHNLILIWMVQQEGHPGGTTKADDAFLAAARAAFAK